MRGDKGSVTLWVLGLTILVLMFGGLAIDLWRVLAVQRTAGAIADAAVVAAASGIDEEHYRTTGEVVLDPIRASDLGLASVQSQVSAVDSVSFVIGADGSTVTVSIVDSIQGGFVAFFSGDDGVLEVTVTATAEPTLIP